MRIKITDDFLDEEVFGRLNEYARTLPYEMVTNPYDGVEYPDISLEVPDVQLQNIVFKLQNEVGSKLKVNAAFFRLSKEGTPCPHQAHNDAAMGQLGFILYMQDGPGGTAFVQHKGTGLRAQPWTGAEWRALTEEANDPDAWETWHMVDMKANRGLLYSAKMLHRAEPLGGFGNSIENGRLVLTIFLERVG